ncbi:Sterol desaturase/sphingolipid hydroxylase, fatty acid hydroxylase superfamily [Neptunomonas qingdaonensis]|uniref:Sterol desaturase/sphingolipid hydroxylase, fatty acid hydroxylase superfamily n=1 Tax=Neptunomonas qingdaonensis TaxID=1045558 RepID=A0A1I2NWD2_9GAMM|nr:Sterol desaturase/sphingolipid hydroxylase, fatty acid hydroxylase superfamily [Neptunomonas qingdaonensis]
MAQELNVQEEATFRLVFFLSAFLICAGIEWFRPKRAWRESRLTRWGINLGIILMNTLIVRLTVGAIAVSAAVWAQQQPLGLFHWLQMPLVISAVLGFLILDMAIWGQHWVTHKLPVLWRLHQVHHTDLDLDVTSALRFHPVEILLSLLYKAVIIVVFGIDPAVVIVFEVVLNASAIFTHANIRLPSGIDKTLRWVICTPDMHRIHHSVYQQETDSNYGFFLSVWDRLFSTYTLEPKDNHLQMQLGLSEYRQQAALGFVALLKLPLQRLRSSRQVP